MIICFSNNKKKNQKATWKKNIEQKKKYDILMRNFFVIHYKIKLLTKKMVSKIFWVLLIQKPMIGNCTLSMSLGY